MKGFITKERVEELTTRNAEPVWLAQQRLSAWEAYLQEPMPNLREEDWRKVDPSELNLSALITVDMPAVKEGGESALPAWYQKALEDVGSHAGFLWQTTEGPGVIHFGQELKKQGVIFCDIATAIEKHSDKLERFMRERADNDGKFNLLTKALFNCGAFLYVPAGVEIAQPFFYGIGFGSCADDNTEYGDAVFPRVIVVAEATSKVNLIHMSGPTTSELTPESGTRTRTRSLSAGETDVFVKPGASVFYLGLGVLPQDVFHMERMASCVEKDGFFASMSVALGGKQTKSEIATYLQAPGATSDVLGAVFGNGRQSFNFNTVEEHNAPDTKSDINFRVALREAASSIYHGVIRVAKVAQRTDAYQQNKNLLLDGDAKADSIPKLEILADDVRCSHGATVGPVDKSQIFYLMSRGLTERQAEQLVVIGFFRKVMDRCPLPTVVEWVSKLVSLKVLAGEQSTIVEFTEAP
jgi:Fe-S cluster assembly protein SufD